MENLDICEELWHAAGPKAHPVAAEGGFTQPSAGAVVHKNYIPPQTPSEVETFKALATTTAIAEEHVEGEGEDSCSKMAAGSKCPPLAPGGWGRKRKYRKRNYMN